MKYLDKSLANRIEEKLSKLNKLRPLPPSAVKKLQEQLRMEMTYNSNALEGNSLTLKETVLVVKEGLTVKGKPLKDHLEAKDHYEALGYLFNLLDKKKKITLSEDLILHLHKMIVQDTDKEWAGRYRNSNVRILGSDHLPPSARKIPREMHKLIDWAKANEKKLSIIELAAIIHHRLVYIHPFFDGNGRTARLVMNLLLMQKGYPLVIILKNDRRKYYRTLSQADKGNLVPFVRFIAQAVSRSLDIYLKTLTPSSYKQEKYLPLAKISRVTPYSAKYLNLLARNGSLEAHKEGRIWLTSKEAVQRYIKNRKRQR